MGVGASVGGCQPNDLIGRRIRVAKAKDSSSEENGKSRSPQVEKPVQGDQDRGRR